MISKSHFERCTSRSHILNRAFLARSKINYFVGIAINCLLNRIDFAGFGAKETGSFFYKVICVKIASFSLVAINQKYHHDSATNY